MGFFGFVATAGWSVGPMVGSYLLDEFSENYRISWIFISLFAFLSGIIFFTIRLFLTRSKDNRLGGGIPNEEN